ncbi:MAG: metallophosphoesterase [Deltaproteobacteria bacterium]|nr:metallophosphoesterase [Deltaproteobacteria bacterium]
MKIHVLSDLHVEFAPFVPPPTDADVVVLAGDIGVGHGGADFARAAFLDKPVLYVCGNHELYRQSLSLIGALKEKHAGTNLHVLDDDAVIIGGVRFIGSTLWTDFDVFGEDRRDEAMVTADVCMNDFRLIENDDGSRFQARHARALHLKSRAFLTDHLALPFDGPTVVITHHGAFREVNAERYRGDLLSAAFTSDLEPLIDGTRVNLWISGHTHHCIDVVKNGTRMVANQRGYPHEPVKGFDPGFVVDV